VDHGRRRRGALEHEVLATLATAGRALTPAEVLDLLDADLAYTTVMTVLSRLADKGLLMRQRAGRAYAYRIIDDEAERTAHRMRLLLDAGNDRTAVLTRFIDELSSDEERLLIDLLGGRADNPAGHPR
jgi:predicted transcriptional regulator